MTNQEILTKAIQKAIDNGFVPIDVPEFESEYFKIKRPTLINEWPWYLVRWMDKNTGVDTEVNIEHVLFSHDFAKALWGEDERKPEKYDGGEFLTTVFKVDWRYHLQQMVISDDPIKYLGENI